MRVRLPSLTLRIVLQGGGIVASVVQMRKLRQLGSVAPGLGPFCQPTPCGSATPMTGRALLESPTLHQALQALPLPSLYVLGVNRTFDILSSLLSNNRHSSYQSHTSVPLGSGPQAVFASISA